MSIRVLIVDDTRTIRYQIKEMLSGKDYELDEASDGLEALVRIGHNKPHIVLMDIMMPNMNGIECCKRIKGDASIKDIKVVMVTTKGEYQKVTEAFRAHCDDYITKPVKESELLSKMEEISRMISARMKLRSL
jgi:two-component system, OmpR family, alkaline phosphatase synthesis response regulator PhoP